MFGGEREEPLPRGFENASLTPRARFITGRYPTLEERRECFNNRGLYVTGREVWLLVSGSDQHLQGLLKEERRLINPSRVDRMLQFLHAGTP